MITKRFVSLALVNSLASMIGLSAADQLPLNPLDDLAFLDVNDWVESVSRRRQLLSEAPQAVSVIDLSSEKGKPAWTLPDRLRYETGVDVYQSRHGQFDVGLRGFNSLGGTRTLVLVDGREITLTELGQVQWSSHLHMSDITRVEIVKGPSSVHYGANAFGGVIAMRGRDIGDAHEVHLYSAAGSDGLLEVDATALGPLNGLGAKIPLYYKISAGLTERETLKAIEGDPPASTPFPESEQATKTDFESTRFKGILGARFSEQLSFEIDAHYVDLPTWQIVEDLTYGASFISVEDLQLGAKLHGDWGEIRYLRGEEDKYFSVQKTQPPSGTNNYIYTQVKLENTFDKLEGLYQKEFGKHFISLGAEYKNWESFSNLWGNGADLNDSSTWATVRMDNVAFSAEDQWQASQHLILNAGIRGDDNSFVGTNVSPRLAMNYKLDDHQFIRASYSSGYRLPEAFEAFIDVYYFSTDENLEAETVDSFDVGWQKTLPHNGLRFSVDAYYNKVDGSYWFVPLPESQMLNNWIDWLTNFAGAGNFNVPPGPFFELQNLDNSATTLGLELEGEWRLPQKGHSIFANATYQDFSYENDVIYQSNGYIDPVLNPGNTMFAFNYNLGRKVNGPPELKGSLGWNWNKDGWITGAVARYVGERDVFTFSTTDFSSGSSLAFETLPDYTALDLTVGYDFGWKQGYRRIIRASVMNLTDDEHHESGSRTSNQLATANEHQRASLVGVTYAVSLSWEF